MAHSPLTLAALATSAVSDLQVTGYHELPHNEDVESSVVLETSLGDVLVQVPRSEVAEVHHSAKILGQSALTAGVRESLPFEAPSVLGVTRFEDTRAMVSTFLHGDRFEVESLTDDALLCESIAETFFAIHTLPRSVITQQGLRVRDAQDARLDALDIIERGHQTGLLPTALQKLWSGVLEDHALWDFNPLVTHGNMSESALLVDSDRVTGVLDWSELSVGDPAVDFAWLWAAPYGVLERVISIYADLHNGVDTEKLRVRSILWHQLQLAKWLLHGVQTRNNEIIDDAVELCDALVSQLSYGSPFAQDASGSTLADAEAAVKPETVPDELSETASFDMLDEDRTFVEDRDFLDSDDTPSKKSASENSADLAEQETIPVELNKEDDTQEDQAPGSSSSGG